MIKVGIIGAGFGAKIHLPGFNQLPDVKVVGIYSQDINKAKQIARQYNISQVFTTWQALVKSKNIDAISIATPPFLHAKIALAAIKNNKAVLCEKPLGINASQTKLLITLAKKHNLINAVDFEWRYLPAFKILKQLLVKRPIGKIRSINMVWATGGRAGANYPINWSNYNKYGGGVLLNYASHVINYVEWLFGKINKVNGLLATTKKFNNVSPKPNADDFTSVQFLLSDQIPGQILVTNVVYNGDGQRLEICGENGTIILHNKDVKDFGRNFELNIYYPTGQIKSIKIPKLPKDNLKYDSRLAPFAALAADFIKGIKKQRLIAPSFAEGHRTQVVLDAIKKSNQLKKWVRV